MIDEKQANIVALTEIKAKRQKDICEPEYHIPGFECFMNANPILGVALYVKENLHAQPCTVLNNHAFNESVWCQFTTAEKKVFYLDAYIKVQTATMIINKSCTTLLGQRLFRSLTLFV